MDGCMNKLYEQWKRVLAGPRTLITLSILSIVGLYLLLSFVFNLAYTVIDLFSELINFGVETFQKTGFQGLLKLSTAPFAKFGKHFFGQFFLHSEYPLVEGIVFFVAYSFLLWKLGPHLYKMRISYKDINKGTKGTARWMQVEEMKRTYETFDIYSSEFQLEHGGYPIAMLPDRRTMLVETDNTNFKALGTSQAARKTQLIFYWCLYLNAMAKDPDSQYVNDLKSDMLMKWLGSPGAKRFDTYAMNFLMPKNSIKYNPFSIVWEYAVNGMMDEAEIELQALGKQLFARETDKDADFTKGASSTFTAIMLTLLDFALKYNQPKWFTYAGLYDLNLNYNKTVVVDDHEFKPLDEYMKTQPSRSRVAKHYMAASSATKKQVQSFYFLMSTTLADFASESILELTSSSDLDFRKMVMPEEGQKPIIVFLASPQGDSNIFETLQGQFTSQMLRVLSNIAQKTKGQKFKRRFRFLGDEINNSAHISGLKSAANVGQQSGLLLGAGMQSTSGFKDVYPGDEGKAILAGLPGTIYLISDEEDDVKNVNKKLGTTTTVAYNRTGDPLDVDKSYTEMEEGRDLMLEDEVSRLAQDELIYMNIKKRTDKFGNDVVANPIYAKKRRITKVRNVPGEPLWKRALGFAKQQEETIFEPYMELIPAFEHLYPGKAHPYFDDRGLGLEDVDLRKNVERDEYGEEIPFDIERHTIPHELVDLTFKMWANRDNVEYQAMDKFEDERKLKILEQELKDGTYYDKRAKTSEIVDEVPQELSDEFLNEPLEIPQVSPQKTEEPSQTDFSADLLITDALGEDYDKIFQFLNEEQAVAFKKSIKTLGQLNDRIMISQKVSEENKKGIEDLLSQAHARLSRKE